MKNVKLLFFVAMSLIAGFILGQAFYNDGTGRDAYQNYIDPQIPVSQFDEMVSVDIIRNTDDIWVVDHYSGHLIFEYNRFKEQDKNSFEEYSNLLLESSGSEADGNLPFLIGQNKNFALWLFTFLLL